MSVQRTLRYAKKLRLFPKVAMEIQRITADPRASILDLERAVSSDPSLTAQLLRLANSPFFGLPRAVSTLSEALMIVGFEATRQLAVALAMLSVAKKGGPGRDGLWRHSVLVGSIASQLAGHIEPAWARQAYVAGLLHDFGTLILLETRGTDHVAIMGQSELERQTYGFDHTELASACLTEWNLPEEICSAVRYHHDPDADPERRRHTDLLWVADQLAEFHETGRDPQALLVAAPCIRLAIDAAMLKVNIPTNAVEIALAG